MCNVEIFKINRIEYKDNMKYESDSESVNLSPEIEPRESIKLIKNTKGYNWEIRLQLDKHIDELHSTFDKKAFDRIVALNNMLEERYGSAII